MYHLARKGEKLASTSFSPFIYSFELHEVCVIGEHLKQLRAIRN